MQKLTYERIGDSVIKIDLRNGYEVVAVSFYNKETSKYKTSLYLKHRTVNLLDLMDNEEDGFDPLEFDATYKTINPAILKQVSTLLSESRFKKYIDRYEYMLECFDKGDDFFTKERLGDK